MLKLETIYQGKKWGVYRLRTYLAEVLPSKSMEEILEEGYLQWEPGCLYPPSVSCNGLPYGNEGVNPPSFLSIAEECPPGFTEITFFKPQRVHLYFNVEYITAVLNLKRGSLYIPLQHLFQAPKNGEKSDIIVGVTDLKEFLEGLERWDVQPTAVLPLYGYYSNSVEVWTDRGIPYPLYWRWRYFSEETNLELEKIAVGAEPTLPLFLKYKDVYHSNIFYLQTKKGLHYAFRKHFSITAEQVTEAFGFSCNQPAEVEMGAYSSARDRYYLPVRLIASVNARKPIKIIWNQSSGWGMRVHPESFDELVLRYPKLMENERFGLVNAPTQGLAEMLEKSGLVKLNKKILAGGLDYTLHYISQGAIHPLPGKYAFAKNTYRSSYLTKKEQKEYESLCSTLTYLLPGKASYWSIEDLKRYDALCRSGRYDHECAVSAGSQRWKIKDENAKQMWLQQNRYVTFTPVIRRIEQTTLWEVIPLEELLHWLTSQYQEPPTEYQLQKVLFYLASKGVRPPVLVECLSSYYGLSAVETALISSSTTNLEQEYQSAYS